MSRRKARMLVVQYIYSLNFNRSYKFGEFLEFMGSLKKEQDIVFAKNLAYSVEKNLKNLDDIVKKYLFPQSKQTSLVDKAILKTGIGEFLYMKDADDKVIINEYIEVSKIFSDISSKSLINAVLDNIRKDYEK